MAARPTYARSNGFRGARKLVVVAGDLGGAYGEVRKFPFAASPVQPSPLYWVEPSLLPTRMEPKLRLIFHLPYGYLICTLIS